MGINNLDSKTNKRLSELLANTGDMALKRRAREIVTHLELKDGLSVLDIGCGDGYYLHLLSKLPYKLKLSGTDYDESGLSRARKNLGKGIPLYQGDLMAKLPFKSNTWDRVVMSEVAEHLPNDVKGLKEVNRVLKKGGSICLTVPCWDFPLLWDPLSWILQRVGTPIRHGFFAGIWNQHERLYKPDQIVSVLKKAGFEVVESKTVTFWCLPFNHYIVNITARLLAAGSVSGETATALSKYSVKPKRSFLLNMAFKFANAVDSLNNWYQPRSGVAVFVHARKK